MRRTVLFISACAAVLASPAVASAVNVAAGPEGRALMTWSSDAGLRLKERTAEGRFTSPGPIAPPKSYPAFVSSGPGGSVTVLAYDESAAGPSDLLLVSRPAGAVAFLAPSPFALLPATHLLRSATNARGDSALLLKPFPGNLVLVTSVRGGPFGQPQEIATESEAAAVAVGGDGRVAVAYYDFPRTGVHVQLGAVGSPLGPATRLSSGTFSDVGAALDEKGNATVAFVRTDERRRARGAELVARRAGADGRFGATAVVARGGPPVMGAGFASFRLAAAGSTTALAFDPNGQDGRLGVAIARGSERFAPAQLPTAAGIRDFARQPFNPALAVDRSGDVLLAYNTGFNGNAVYATERRAGRQRFASPRVISSLGFGGAPVPALLSDRTRLVAWDYDGDLFYATRLAGRRPDLSPPRATVTLPGDTDPRLRASNTARVRIRCSEACLVTGRATLRTSTGRNIQGAGRKILNAGAAFTKRFTFDPAARAGRARGGSILRVTIGVENASGASRETVKQITLRKR